MFCENLAKTENMYTLGNLNLKMQLLCKNDLRPH